MKKIFKIIIIILILAILLAGGFIVYKTFFGGEKYRLVKVEEINGSVDLSRYGNEKDIFEGMNLQPNDSVETGKKSDIELLVDDDKHIYAGEKTGFTINAEGNSDEGKVSIKLKYGEGLFVIDNKLNDDSEFEVKTSNAACTVRGTTFTVSYDPDTNTTIVSVEKGKVLVTTKKDEEIMVNAGETVIITDNTILTEASSEEDEEDVADAGDEDETEGNDEPDEPAEPEEPVYVAIADSSEYEDLLVNSIDANQLAYCIGIMDTTNDIAFYTDPVTCALFDLYYWGVDSDIISTSGGNYKYSVDDLNTLFAIMNYSEVTDSNIPALCSMSNGVVTCGPPTITGSITTTVTLNNAIYSDADGIMYVEYSIVRYESTDHSDGPDKNTVCVATLVNDGNGYVITEIQSDMILEDLEIDYE